MEKILRCKNIKICGNKTRCPQTHMCWRMWQLCGDCAVIEHPEAYLETYVKKTITKLKVRSKNVTAL